MCFGWLGVLVSWLVAWLVACFGRLVGCVFWLVAWLVVLVS